MKKDRKDKQKVLDEVWTIERVKSFLDIEAPVDVNIDFHRLLKAYQSMREENFAQYVELFKASGGDLNACNEQGETVLEIINQHANGAPYAELIRLQLQ